MTEEVKKEAKIPSVQLTPQDIADAAYIIDSAMRAGAFNAKDGVFVGTVWKKLDDYVSLFKQVAESMKDDVVVEEEKSSENDEDHS